MLVSFIGKLISIGLGFAPAGSMHVLSALIPECLQNLWSRNQCVGNDLFHVLHLHVNFSAQDAPCLSVACRLDVTLSSAGAASAPVIDRFSKCCFPQVCFRLVEFDSNLSLKNSSMELAVI